MTNEPKFEQIREELEARQRSILWPDYLRATRNVFESLWKGDPKAKPVQRVGLVLFALHSWVVGVFFVALAWSSGTWFGRIIGVPSGLISVLLSIRVFLNAFLRQNIPHEVEQDGMDSLA
ncbi:MAG: hypothetical protein ABSB30_07905 [Terracidiphilus sp.]|jgi:hypothetical protein